MDAETWDARYAETGLVWSAGPNQFVAAECAELPPGRAVDLAAGEGRNAIWLARRGWRVTAVDFSQVALDKGRTLAGGGPEAEDVGDRIEWVRADATAWTGTGYDLAVLAYLQLRAEERRAAVRAAFDALVPGGVLLVVAHDSTNLTEGTGGPQDAAVLYTAEDVLGDLDGRPLEVARATRVPREVAADPSHRHGGEPARTAWDALVRVVRR